MVGFAGQSTKAAAKPVVSVEVAIRSRLLSVLSTLERQGDALGAFDDARIDHALQAMQSARAEIVAAVAALGQLPNNGASS